jgi:hypothetical protein
MVLLVLLATIDLLCAISLAALVLGYPLPHLQAGAALMLIAKSVFFITDVISILDIAVGITMFVLLWVSAPTLALGLAIYLGFKAVISFI